MRFLLKKQSKNKRMRNFNKTELLVIIKNQEEENQRLKEELRSLNKIINEREIKISKAGSLAEAALNISAIFEEAQKSADIYLKGIKHVYYERQRLCEELRNKTEEQERKQEHEKEFVVKNSKQSE